MGGVVVMNGHRTSLVLSLLAAGAMPFLVGCRSAAPEEALPAAARMCLLAISLRDQWLAANPSAESAILVRGEIASVADEGRGWHVAFVTRTGHGVDTPEGMHDYFLHVYLDAEGRLLRVERGPDLVS